MKKGKWLVWALITVAVFFIARMLFDHFGVFGGRGMGGQAMAQFHGKGGHFRGGMEMHRMGGHGRHGGHGGFGFFSILVQIGLFLIGWVTWKLAAGNRIRKWIGLALMALGALLLLPKVLVLPAMLIVAYFVYKMNRNQDASSAAYVPAADVQSVDSYTADYLDQWEQNIQKEEK